MNAIVKTFVFVNFFLIVFYSAVQMVLFTNRQDWKSKHENVNKEYGVEKEKLSKRIEELDGLLKNKEVSYTALNDKATTLEGSIAELDAKLKAQGSELKTSKQELGEKSIRVSTLEESQTKNVEELSKVREQLTIARDAAETARTKSLEHQMMLVNLEKEKGKLTGAMEISQNKIKKLEEDLKEHSRVMARLESRGIKVDEILAAGGVDAEKPINAKVLTVRADVNVVLLSVGRNDMVKEGYQFTVYNGGTYKGKVMVESVYPNMCSARILKELMADTQTIQEGDNASTRVY